MTLPSMLTCENQQLIPVVIQKNNYATTVHVEKMRRKYQENTANEASTEVRTPFNPVPVYSSSPLASQEV